MKELNKNAGAENDKIQKQTNNYRNQNAKNEN